MSLEASSTTRTKLATPNRTNGSHHHHHHVHRPTCPSDCQPDCSLQQQLDQIEMEVAALAAAANSPRHLCDIDRQTVYNIDICGFFWALLLLLWSFSFWNLFNHVLDKLFPDSYQRAALLLMIWISISLAILLGQPVGNGGQTRSGAVVLSVPQPKPGGLGLREVSGDHRPLSLMT